MSKAWAGEGDFPEQQIKILQPEVHVHNEMKQSNGFMVELGVGVAVALVTALILYIVKRKLNVF